MTKRLREKLGQLLGRKPPQMQVAALCRDPQGQVLLVTSRDTGRWIIPKGWPMPGRTLADAAGQEAWEEAGVRGSVSQAQIGSYHYDKRQDRGFAIPVEVRVYDLAVEELAERYPEVLQRRRGWFAPERAAQLVAESGLQALLRGLGAPPHGQDPSRGPGAGLDQAAGAPAKLGQSRGGQASIQAASLKAPGIDKAGIDKAGIETTGVEKAGSEPPLGGLSGGRRPKARQDGAAERGGKARKKLRRAGYPDERPNGQAGGQAG